MRMAYFSNEVEKETSRRGSYDGGAVRFVRMASDIAGSESGFSQVAVGMV